MSINVGKVAMISTAKVEIGERARKEMGDINELEFSMKESGMINPLAVKENGDGKYTLLAGERRFTVLVKNGVSEIPARIYDGTLSDLEMKIIELSENLYRKDFEWFEHDNLVKEIHLAQQQLHGEKVSTSPDAPGWGMKETGDAINASKASVSLAIKRAEAREAFPQLFEKCKTQSDASKVLSKLNETTLREAVAKRLEEQKGSHSIQQLANNYIIEDFFTGIKSIQGGSIHLVEVDPPYGIDLKARKKKEDGISSAALDSYNEVDSSDYPKFLKDLLHECYRVMSDHSWLIFWFAPEPWFDTVYTSIIDAGFKCNRMCGIWVKPGASQCMNPNINLANGYEMFFWAKKGDPAVVKAGRNNVFTYAPVPPSQKIHPTERPLDLMRDIYETFCWDGSRILIPFLGSGSGLIAAESLGMSAFGYELSKQYRDSFLVKIHSMGI